VLIPICVPVWRCAKGGFHQYLRNAGSQKIFLFVGRLRSTGAVIGGQTPRGRDAARGVCRCVLNQRVVLRDRPVRIAHMAGLCGVPDPISDTAPSEIAGCGCLYDVAIFLLAFFEHRCRTS
jgi:hypothetical protein